MAEGPVENPTPAPTTADSGTAAGATAAPLPLAEALRAVMDAVGRTGDLPAGAAGLDRASWSVAVGRFISSPKSYQQSAVSDPLKRLPSAPTQDRG